MTSTVRKKNPSLSGIVTPVITPLVDSEHLDYNAMSALFDRLICGGVSGLFLLGTTGEFAGMSHSLRHEYVREGAKIIAGRLPVYVGISDTSFSESVELARTATESGARAVVLTSPYYYRFPPFVMREYLTKMANAIPLPLILYNMPGNTHVTFDTDTLRFIVETPQFTGVKDSGGDFDYFEKLCDLASVRDDFAVMMGPDSLLGRAILAGADGGVCSGSNLVPDVYVGMYRAAMENDQKKMAALQKKIDLVQRIYHTPQNGLGVVTGLKTALNMLGIGSCQMTYPFPAATPQEVQEIREVSEQLGLFGA